MSASAPTPQGEKELTMPTLTFDQLHDLAKEATRQVLADPDMGDLAVLRALMVVRRRTEMETLDAVENRLLHYKDH